MAIRGSDIIDNLTENLTRIASQIRKVSRSQTSLELSSIELELYKEWRRPWFRWFRKTPDSDSEMCWIVREHVIDSLTALSKGDIDAALQAIDAARSAMPDYSGGKRPGT